MVWKGHGMFFLALTWKKRTKRAGDGYVPRLTPETVVQTKFLGNGHLDTHANYTWLVTSMTCEILRFKVESVV